MIAAPGERAARTAGAVVFPAAIAVAVSIVRDARVVYTSDSTAQQGLVRTWLDVGHGVAHLPPDTWALKFPLYLVIELLPLTPLHRILVAVVVVNAITFVLVGVAAMFLAPRARWYELAAPLVWLAALGGGFGSNRNLTNYRNIELGLCFLMLLAVARYLGETTPGSPQGDAPGGTSRGTTGRWRRLTGWAGAVLLLTLFWFDDPYFAWLVGAPLAVLALGWFFLRHRDIRLVRLAGALVVSLALLPVGQLLVRLAGIQVERTKELSPGIAVIWQDLDEFVLGAATQFGVQRWAGQPPLAVAAQVLTLVTLILLVCACGVLAVRGWRSAQLVPCMIAVSGPLAIAGTLAQEHHPSRYLILVPVSLAIAAVMVLPVVRTPAPWFARALLLVLAGTAVCSTWLSVSQAADASSRPSTALTQQQALVDAVRATGIQKGFGPFWSANITSYLAGGGTTVYELRCREGQLLADRTWLSDTVRLTRPAQKSFLIWVPGYFGPLGCTTGQADALLGPPSGVQVLLDGTQVRVYPRDIAARLASRTEP